MSALATTRPSQLERSDLRRNGEVRRGGRKIAGRSALVVLVLLAIVTGSLAGLMLVYSVDLPQIEELERYRPSTVTDLYDRNGKKIGSFALENRQVVPYEGFAPVLRQAVVSIEDKNFWSHWGVNMFRVAGAAWHDIRSQGRAQGASTLTMQLARNLFLSSERTAKRKVEEAFLAIQIERTFTKQQIFTLYGNEIYLGSGMYGFEAASQFYFSKHASELSLTEAALLAGLPKGPSAFSPLLNPDKALKRRNLVLSVMEDDKLISQAEAEAARNSPLGLHLAPRESAVAPWFQEEVRKELVARFGSQQVHEAGLRIDTTLDIDLQRTANHAVGDGLAAYEHRHGWTGRFENVLEARETLESYRHPDWTVQISPGDYVHALVTKTAPGQIDARIGPPGSPGSAVVMLPEDWAWTGWQSGASLAKPGDIVYVHLGVAMQGAARRATLEQDSGVQGALMAIDNTSGDVLAMVGGRDYQISEFNRATQAERQTGSSFKPYVYTAAIEAGAKPTDTIVDGPVDFNGYTPHNYENDYKGTMTLASAFAESRNIPALKLAARVGINKVIEMAQRFGVTTRIPPYLPIAIGAVEISLAEQVASYAVFPNDGVRVEPRMVRKVTNADGIVLWDDRPKVKEVIGTETARTMMTLLEGVISHGTGAAASQLHHPLGGKTGTTSDFTDAWFLGFSPSITCGVWVGFDSRQQLGEKETGAMAALPIWMSFMRTAVAGKDNEQFPVGASLPQLNRAAAQLPAATSAAAVQQKPATSTSAAQKPVERPAAAAKPVVRPALPPAAAPAPTRVVVEVKPALPGR